MISAVAARYHLAGIICSAIAIFILICSIPNAVAEAADEPGVITREDILKAWTERAEKVTSAHFEWTEVRQTSDDLLLPGETRAEPNVPQYSVSSSLSFKKDQIRHTFRKAIWQAEAPRGENQYVSVTNGTTSKVYLPPGYVADYPRGHESQEVGTTDVTSTYLKPFLWCYRPSMTDVLVAPFEAFEITQERVNHQGRECAVLRYQASETASFELLIDPSRDYVIVRQQYVIDGNLSHQLDIDYQQDEATSIWIPQDWRFAMLNKHAAPLLSVNGTLTHANINPKLPESEFEFEFPPGTWVHGDGSREHIVMADGRRRVIALSERGLSIDTLLSGASEQGTRSWWRTAWVRINIVLFLFASAGLTIHWYRTRAQR